MKEALRRRINPLLWAFSIIVLLLVYLMPVTPVFSYPGSTVDLESYRVDIPSFELNLSHLIISFSIAFYLLVVFFKLISWESVSNYLVMFLMFLFLLSHFPASLMLSKTTTTGGDTGSDNYIAGYLRDYLIPHGKLIGWSQGRWLGYPMFQYIFILPYLVMVLMSYAVPLEIAFKIVSVFGVFTLPLFTYFAVKYMGFKFPTPIISSIFSISLLFQEKNNVFGGNIPSVLAGEFSYSISLSFMILFLGVLYRSIEAGRFSICASVLFALTALSHACTTINAALISLFFLIEPLLSILRSAIFSKDYKKHKDDLVKGLKVMSQTYILSFLLMAFFLVPIVFKMKYSTDYGGDWAVSSLYSWYQLPDAYVYHVLAALGLIIWLKTMDKKAFFLIFSFFMSVFAFFNGEALKTANVRFFPIQYFFVLLIAAYAVGEIASWLKGKWVIPIILCLAMMLWTNQTITYIDGWVKWNYEGYEVKPAWNDYKGIMDLVSGTPGRLHNDLSEDNNRFGTPRAFETTPYFSNKWTLEGVYAQAALSSPYVSYFQCEMSKGCAGIPRVEGEERTTTYNIEAGTKHAKLINVKDYVAVYPKLKEDLAKNPEWKLIGTFGDHQVYNLQTNKGNYVEVPEYEPILVETDHWRGLSLEWYTNLDNIDVPLAFVSSAAPEDLQRFKARISDDLKAQMMLRKSLLRPEFINDWLLCGTFPNPRDIPLNDQNYWNLSLDHGLSIAYIDEAKAAPDMNADCAGRRWVPELANSMGYVDLRLKMYPKDEVVAYAHTYVYSPADQKVRFLYGSDDGMNIWLNGQLVKEDHVHRAALPDHTSVDMDLKKGWNRLLIKVEQLTGGWGFYARITDLDGRTIPNLAYQSQKPKDGEIPVGGGSEEALKRIKLDNDCDIEERVLEEEVRFKTNCVGKPHIIKVSYFPNWKVEGADKIYLVSPAFMLVYPTQENVRLYYGETPVDTVGNLLTILGIVITLALLAMRYKGAAGFKNARKTG